MKSLLTFIMSSLVSAFMTGLLVHGIQVGADPVRLGGLAAFAVFMALMAIALSQKIE
jgi:hypothetical protein